MFVQLGSLRIMEILAMIIVTTIAYDSVTLGALRPLLSSCHNTSFNPLNSWMTYYSIWTDVNLRLKETKSVAQGDTSRYWLRPWGPRIYPWPWSSTHHFVLAFIVHYSKCLYTIALVLSAKHRGFNLIKVIILIIIIDYFKAKRTQNVYCLRYEQPHN